MSSANHGLYDDDHPEMTFSVTGDQGHRRLPVRLPPVHRKPTNEDTAEDGERKRKKKKHKKHKKRDREENKEENERDEVNEQNEETEQRHFDNDCTEVSPL